MKKNLLLLINNKHEIISFAFIGLIVTAINYLLYSVFVVCFAWNINICNILAWIIAVFVAFLLNKIIVFKSKSWKLQFVTRELYLFVTARFLTGIIEIGFVPIFIYIGLKQTLFGIEGSVAKIISEFITMFCSYFFSKYLVFNKQKNISATDEIYSDLSVVMEYHADDYGLFCKQSERILDCHKNGVLNGISVMTNSPYFKICMEMIKNYIDELYIAVHLNFMEGYCLSEPKKILSIVDNNGVFNTSFGKLLIISYLPVRNKYKKQLKEEIRAQINYILPYIKNKKIRIDSHAHYHMVPVVFDALMEVINEEKISVSYIRMPKENLFIYLPHLHDLTGVRLLNLLKVIILNLLCWRNWNKHKEILKSLDRYMFMGVFLSGNYNFNNVSLLLDDAKRFAKKKGLNLELLAHPGAVWETEDIEKLTNKDDVKFLTSNKRQLEAEMFCSF